MTFWQRRAGTVPFGRAPSDQHLAHQSPSLKALLARKDLLYAIRNPLSTRPYPPHRIAPGISRRQDSSRHWRDSLRRRLRSHLASRFPSRRSLSPSRTSPSSWSAWLLALSPASPRWSSTSPKAPSDCRSSRPYGGPAGIAHLLGPNGGFLFSYPLAAATAGWVVRAMQPRITTPFRSALVAAIAATLPIFLLGAGWFAFYAHHSAARNMVTRRRSLHPRRDRQDYRCRRHLQHPPALAAVLAGSLKPSFSLPTPSRPMNSAHLTTFHLLEGTIAS